jgi:pectate lyase
MTRGLVLSTVVLWLAAGSARANPDEHLKKSDAWFGGDEAREVAACILSHQSELGGWPKNVSTTSRRYSGEISEIRPTYDNGATTDELRFLARIYNVTKEPRYRTAFDRGLSYVLEGQYPNGGWPQSYPPRPATYERFITFNDNAMVRLLVFVREVATDERYAFVEQRRRKDAADAFDRGIVCILKCQITVNDTLTVWCAQHDEVDYQPRSARTYELATLSGAESVGITRLLMSLESPSPEIIRAVEAAVAWFRKVKLTGIRVDTVTDPRRPKGTNKVVVNDPTAGPLWARFYSIQTNQPVLCDRDGIVKSTLAEIGYERRNGYAWYGTWPQKLVEVEYPAWTERVTPIPGR